MMMKDMTRCRPRSADAEPARADAARRPVAPAAEQPGHLGQASPAGQLPRYLGNLGVQQVVASGGVPALWRCGPHPCDCSAAQRAAAGEPRVSEPASEPVSQRLRGTADRAQRGSAVSHPDDPAEREADRVAEAVLRAPDPALMPTEHPAPTISRWAAGGSVDARPGPLGAEIGAACRTAGEPIADPTRQFMEARFGRDLGAVRVHTDPGAAELAHRVDARAFTTGQHVFFAAGQYRPDTPAGRLLMAHELVHVVQQAPASDATGVAPRQVARQPAAPAPPAPPAPTPAPQYWKPCTGDPPDSPTLDPCRQTLCTGNQTATIAGDLTRAIGYVDAAIAALRATPLADATVRALDWYFTSHSQSTADAVRTELECIRWSLNDTQTTGRWGCHPNYGGETLGYTCASGVGTCAHHLSPVCLTSKHFGRGARERAEVVIHECAHKEGMSTGDAQTRPDVYQWHARFRNLSTAAALLNSDSYALFATAVTGGVPLSGGINVGASGGLATAGAGRTTWYARLYASAELQHPRLSIFNPTLGLGMTFIGAPATVGTTPAPTSTPSLSLLYSLLPGVRIGPPRPGAAGSGYASFFGGPALALGKTGVALGAEAGVAVGYRWRWLDVSTNIGYVYDPTRRERGGENLLTVGAAVSFAPLTF
jgi:Domain of unknown function (DUF4157)/Lysine-specific metallo-endopeptidase